MSSNQQEQEASAGSGELVALDDVMSNIGVGYFHHRLLLVCGFGFSAVAVEVLVLGFLMPELRSDPDWKVDEYSLSWLATTTHSAAICGALAWGAFADRFGRRFGFMVTVFFVAFFGCLSAFSTSLFSLNCLRCAVHFGTGGSVSTDFTLYSEFLPTQNRGGNLCRLQVFWCLGQIAAVGTAWAVIPAHGWRMFLIASSIPSLLALFLRPLIPESPRWLLLHGRLDEATEVVRHMAIMNGLDPANVGLRPGATLTLAENAATPLAALPQSASFQSKSTLRLVGQLFNSKLLSTTIGMIIFGLALHCISYANLTFMPTMLAEKGVARLSSYHFMMCMSFCEIPAVLMIMFLSKYVGRLAPMRMCLLLVCFFLLAFASAQGTVALMFCICGSGFFVEACWGLYHVYIPEAYPTELRATANGWIDSFAKVISLSIPFVTAYLLQNVGLSSVCVFFSICSALGSLGAYTFLRIETCDRDLEDYVVHEKPV